MQSEQIQLVPLNACWAFRVKEPKILQNYKKKQIRCDKPRYQWIIELCDIGQSLDVRTEMGYYLYVDLKYV